MPLSAERAVAAALAPFAGRPVGLAVSGGSDSVALLHLAAAVGVAPLAVVTVDHGLRPEARAEAEAVGRAAAALGLPHDVRSWEHRAGGNLQDSARRARMTLIADWAAAKGIAAVALGHTLDDQAETLLMRLARGSGVDGLAGMAARREALGVTWLRPLLGERRAALRAWLAARGIGWVEDPSNDDTRFERVKARRALAVLAPLGIDAARLAETAARLGAARAALGRIAADVARAAITVEAGDVVVAGGVWEAASGETRHRLLAHAIRWIGRGDYPPRRAGLDRVEAALASGRASTCAGTRVAPTDAGFRIGRELRAVAGLSAPPGALWDGRWRVTGPFPSEACVAALGPAGLAGCPGWRATGLPRATLLAGPAAWHGDTLLAAPLAGLPNGYAAELAGGRGGFLAGLLAH